MGPKTKTKPKPVPQSLTSGPVDQGRRSAQLTNTRAAPSRLKVVVRRLPPALPEPVFWSSVASWVALPPDLTAAPPVSTSAVNTGVDSVVWAQYRPGKVRARHDKDDTHSRAYLSFKSPEALIAFHHAYDGWNFKARTGQVTRAVVEFAPYQNTRSVSNKRDPRQGTIEQDPDFIAFQDALANPKVPQVELPAKITPTSTPLLDHLRARKAAARSASRGKIPALAQGPPPPKPSKRSKKETSKETTPVAVAAIAPAKSPLKKSSRRKVAQKSVTNERGGSAFDSESKSELKSARGVKQESKTKPSEAENQVVATKSRVIAATEAAKPKQAREAPTPTQIAEATELVRRTLQTKHQAKYQGGALAKPAPPQKKAARPPKDQSIRSVPLILQNPARKPASPGPAPAAAPAAPLSITGPSPVSSAASVPPPVQPSSGSSSRGARRNRVTGSPGTPTDTRPTGTGAPFSEQTARLGAYPSQPITSAVDAQSGNGNGQSSGRGGGGARGRVRGRGRGGGGG